MHSIFRGVLLIAVTCLVVQPCAGQDRTGPDARRQFDEACERFNRGEIEPAAAALDAFLHDHPRSDLAPEAAFKLAAAYRLQGKAAEADKAYERLVREHLVSPWSVLAMMTSFDEKRLLTLAKEYAKKGRDGSATDTTAAVRVFQICLNRCRETGKGASGGPPAEAQKIQKEALYRLGDCLKRLGQVDPFLAVMRQVEAADGTGPWGTLASIRLGDARTFQSRMDDLMNLQAEDDEELWVFLDLAREHGSVLEETSRVKALFYQARCRFALKQEDQAVAFCREVLAKHPRSLWAAEAAMRLAEYYHGKGDTRAMKAVYADVASKFPDSPRAGQARTWAAWNDAEEDAWKELGTFSLGLAKEASSSNHGFALRVRRVPAAGQTPFEGRVAFRNPYHYLLSVSTGPAGFLLARGEDASYFRFADRDEIVKSNTGVDLPLPHFTATDAGSCNLTWGGDISTTPDNDSPVRISPGAVLHFLGERRSDGHLHKTARALPGGHRVAVYRLEQPYWSHPNLQVVELEVADGKALREIRWTSYSEKGEVNQWVVSDLVLGGPIPEAALTPEVPPGMAMREVDSVNQMEVFAGIMRWVGVLMEMSGHGQKKPG